MSKNHRTIRAAAPADPLRFLLVLMLSVAALYAGKSVILPLALAVLLAFILTPMVMSVQRRGLARGPAVLVVLCFSLFVVGGVGYVVGTQVGKLANELPTYAGQVQQKIERLKATGARPFSRVIDAFEGMGAAAKKPSTVAGNQTQTVVVESSGTSAFEKLLGIGGAVVEPIADIALIFVLVAFMLIRREDLRNRIIGLLGHGRLTGTTRVFVESAERISRLLLMQLCVNTGFGIVFGLMLLVVGVPYWFLWGFLTVLLRFVPYVGSWLAAAMPIALSFAVFPGWSQPLELLAFFIALDVLTANVVEPLLFGHSTGVTPVALLIAAVFWTWVWGPMGLVLSTPLTVCLVVMGQHVPTLRFLSLLMGDEAPLEPHVAYYQRLLAGDRVEAQTIAERFGRTKGWEELSDSVVVPALRMARRDRAHAGLGAEDEAFVFDSTQGVIDALRAAMPGPPLTPLPSSSPVLGCAAHHRAEEISLQLLGAVLAPTCSMEVISTRTLPVEIEARVEREKPEVVFIAILPPGGISQARHLCRRLRGRFPELKIVVGYLGKVRDFDRLLTTLRAAGASYVCTSIVQSGKQIRAVMGSGVVVGSV